MIRLSSCKLQIAAALVALAVPAAVMAQPVVSNVQFTQQATPMGTEVVITYDLASPSRPVNITLGLSKDGGTDNYIFPITSATGDLTNVSAGTGKSITWAIATDYPNEAIPNARIQVTADDGCPEAKNDFVATDDNTVLNGNVFANNGAGPDVDTGGGTLTVTALNSNPALVGVPTVVGSGATVTLNANGTFTYDPGTAFDALQVGQQAADSFIYTLTDGTASCPSVATVNVTINGANDAPVVVGESYETVGNTTLQVAATKTIDGSVFVVGNLLANDSDPDGPNPLRTVLQTSNNVTGMVNLDGTFAMTPLAFVAGPYSFTYRVEDGSTFTLGTVTLSLVGNIWYVQNNSAPGGTGRMTDPFDTLAEAQSASVAGETIYIFAGDGTTTGQNAGILLKSNQRLIGQGSPLGAPGTVNGQANPQLRAAGATPVLGSASGNVVQTILNNTIRGFNITDRPANGSAILGTNFGTLTADTISISGTGNILALTNGTLAASFPNASSSGGFSGISLTLCSGNLDIDAGTISGSTGATFALAGGSVNVTYSGSMTQANNAALVSISGDHTGTVQFDTGTLSATDGTGLQFGDADGIYNFFATTTLNGGDAGIDFGSDSNGNFTFSNCPITNPIGAAFVVNGGSGSIGHAGAISKSGGAGRLVSIQNRTAGSVTLTGNLSSTGTSTGILVDNCTGGTVTFSGGTKTLSTGTNQAVTLTNNTGATINFTGGGLDIDTTSASGFVATGGAAGISVQGSGNTIDATSGTALNVANTTISSGSLVFQRISSGNNTAAADPANGIVLDTTGSSGGLTVTGTGAVDSGGVIQNCTGTSVLMTSATSVSLSRMRIQGSGDDGINTSSVNGFSLADSSVLNNGNSTTDEGIELGNPAGTITLTNVTATGNAHNNVFIDDSNNTGGNSALVVSGGSFSSTGTPNGNHGFLMTIRGTAILAASTISGATFSNNFSIGLQVTGGDTATISGLTVSGCTFTDTGSANSQEVAMDFAKGQQSNMTVKVLNNTTITGHNSHAMNFFTAAGAGTTGTYNATISGNVIGNSAVAGSGSKIGNGIRININGDADATVLVDNNMIRQCPNGRGIEAISRNGTGGLDLTITNNDVNPQDTSGFPLAAIFAQSNTVTVGNTLRADIRGNTVPVGTAFDLLSTFITLVETSASTCQLVDTAPASANATAQLTNTNTGSASANAGVSLIAGPISLPPP